jgi:hypothetical protein
MFLRLGSRGGIGRLVSAALGLGLVTVSLDQPVLVAGLLDV